VLKVPLGTKEEMLLSCLSSMHEHLDQLKFWVKGGKKNAQWVKIAQMAKPIKHLKRPKISHYFSKNFDKIRVKTNL